MHKLSLDEILPKSKIRLIYRITVITNRLLIRKIKFANIISCQKTKPVPSTTTKYSWSTDI